MDHSIHVKVRGQFESVNSLLLLCRLRDQTQTTGLVYTGQLTVPKSQIPNKIVLFLLGLLLLDHIGILILNNSN